MTIPHNLLPKVLVEVVNFVFNLKLEVTLIFQKHQSTSHQKIVNEILHKPSFGRCHLIFHHRNIILPLETWCSKQEIEISMITDAALCRTNHFLHLFESKYVEKLISKGYSHRCKFHGTSRFRGNLCKVNSEGEFRSSYKRIYSKQLELELEYQGEHAIFLNLNIAVENNTFAHKVFEKKVQVSFLYSAYASSVKQYQHSVVQYFQSSCK